MYLDGTPSIDEIPVDTLEETLSAEYVPVSIEHTHETERIPWENTGRLYDAGVLSHRCGERHYLISALAASDEELNRIEWAYFPKDRIGYIHWTHTHAKFRRSGVASTVRRYVLDALKPAVSYVYSCGHSKSGVGLMRSQGFQQCKRPSIGEWYVINGER
jgi:GNAT superfamily N-acetyltransferase